MCPAQSGAGCLDCILSFMYFVSYCLAVLLSTALRSAAPVSNSALHTSCLLLSIAPMKAHSAVSCTSSIVSTCCPALQQTGNFVKNCNNRLCAHLLCACFTIFGFPDFQSTSFHAVSMAVVFFHLFILSHLGSCLS